MSNTFNLKESYLSNLGDNNNTTINAVDKDLDEKNKTIPKESKQDFEDFKTQYKGVIDMKCSQDYGNSDDKDLWEDCAKELFLKSKNYILLGDEYEPKPLEKKTESKNLKESNDINVGDEYINDYGAKITILEPTKDGEYQFKVTNTKTGKEGTEVFATRSMRNVLDMNGYKKVESKNSSDNYQIRKYPNEDEFKGTWGLYDLKQNKFIQKGSKYVMQAALKDITNKQLNEADMNVYRDKDEADYYRYQELYSTTNLARHYDAMKNAEKACKAKGIKLYKNADEKYNNEKQNNLAEVKENDLSKDLYQDEANRRITKMLMYLDIYLEAYDKALEENDSYNIALNETKIDSKIEYLIPALNIKGGIKGLIKYLEENEFTFENRFKEFAHLLQNFDKEIKTENNDNEKEPINVFSKDSEEYKRLQKACDLLNEKTNENVEFFIEDVYFDYDQKWKWTTITTKDLITGTTWHTLNPAEQKNIINGKDLNNIVDNVLSGSLYKDFRLDAVNESLDDNWDSEAEDLEKKFKDAYEEYKKNNKYPLSYLDWNNLLSIRDKEKIIAGNKKTESKVDNLALNQFRNIIDLADKGYKVDLVAADGTKVSFDEEDLKAMYVGLVGNDNDLIKLPSEENPQETRNFIQSQLDKSYNKKYESRPDKDAARTRMFNRSRKKLNMSNKFTSIDEIVSYLEKCEDQIDVVNVNTEVGSFNRQLHNDMLSFANKFIKENGYLEPYIDKDGNEQEGNFKKFKQEMIDFVKNYNLKTESKKDELLSRLEDPKFEYLAYFADNLDKIEKIIDNCNNKAKCRKYKEVLKSARAFNDGRNKKEGLDKNTIKKGIKDTLKRDNGIYTDDSIYDFIEAITGIKNIDDIPEDVYNKVAKVANELLNTNYKTESKLIEGFVEDGNSYFRLKLDTANIAEEGDPDFINKVKKLLQQVISNLEYTQDVVIKDIGVYGFGFEGVEDAISKEMETKYITDGDSYLEIKIDTSSFPEDNSYISTLKQTLMRVISNLQYTDDAWITDRKGDKIGKYGFGFEGVLDAITEARQVKMQEDQYENERRKGRPNINKIAEAEFYDNQDWYIQHIKDYKDEKDFIEKEKAEIASEYNLTEIRSELVCKQIYQLAKENNLI